MLSTTVIDIVILRLKLKENILMDFSSKAGFQRFIYKSEGIFHLRSSGGAGQESDWELRHASKLLTTLTLIVQLYFRLYSRYPWLPSSTPHRWREARCMLVQI